MFEMYDILTDVEKAVVGHCLFLLYGRGRSSDGQRIAAMDFDIGQDGNDVNDVTRFIEALALSTKTAKSKERKRTFLPSTCTWTSLSGTQWWESRTDVRRELGFP